MSHVVVQVAGKLAPHLLHNAYTNKIRVECVGGVRGVGGVEMAAAVSTTEGGHGTTGCCATRCCGTATPGGVREGGVATASSSPNNEAGSINLGIEQFRKSPIYAAGICVSTDFFDKVREGGREGY